MFSYDDKWIYRYDATDDDRQFAGLTGPELAAKVMRECLKEIEPAKLAVVATKERVV